MNILVILLPCWIFALHRKLQEDLTDEMVDLARQLKESSLVMNQSVQETEKVGFLLCWHWFFLWIMLPQFNTGNKVISAGCLLRMFTYWLLLMQILDSTERAVEHSLASTGRATTRAAEVYSLASKTTCFQWLLIFVMTCMFVMVVLLIRITWCHRGHWHRVNKLSLRWDLVSISDMNIYMNLYPRTNITWEDRWNAVS